MKFACLFIILDLFRYGISHYFGERDTDNEHQRMVGGEVANIEDYPATACMVRKDPDGDNFRGGAVIIGKYWVVTAAHCMKYISDDHIQAKKAVVRSNSRFWESSYKEHLMVGKYVREKYSVKFKDFDIALVKVKEPFRTENEKPITLANTNYRYLDHTSTVTLGWGTTDPNAPPYFYVEELRVVNVSLINFELCQQKFTKKTNRQISKRMVCAGAPGKDSCVYDSGGPLYQNNILIGIVSWGPQQCANENLPGVYTKISVLYKWIRDKVKAVCRTEKRKRKYF